MTSEKSTGQTEQCLLLEQQLESMGSNGIAPQVVLCPLPEHATSQIPIKR